MLDFPLPGPYHAAIFAPHLEALATNFSIATESARYDVAFTEILVEYFRADRSCKSDTVDQDVPPKIDVRDMLGLFLTLGAAGAVALVIAFLERVDAAGSLFRSVFK